jgi:hypothetical protein
LIIGNYRSGCFAKGRVLVRTNQGQRRCRIRRAGLAAPDADATRDET